MKPKLVILLIISISCIVQVVLAEENYKLLWDYETEGDVNSVLVSSDGSYIAVADEDNVYFYNNNGKLLWRKKGDRLKSVSVSSNGSYIAVTGINGVFFYNKQGKLLWNKEGRYFRISVSISSDGSYTAVANDDYLEFYNTQGNLLWSYKLPIYSMPETVSVSGDGSFIAVGSYKGVFYFNKNGINVWQYNPINVYNVIISKYGYYIAVTSNHGLFLINKEGKVIWQDSNPLEEKSVSISSDGSYIAANSRQEVLFFNRQGNQITKSDHRGLNNNGGTICCVSISSDGSYIVIGLKYNGKIEFYVNLERRAKVVIEEAIGIVESERVLGSDISTASLLISQAEQAFSEKDYEKASEFALQVKNEIENINKKINETDYIIDQVDSIISQEKAMGYDTAVGEELHFQAKQAFSDGDYSRAIELANQAKSKVGEISGAATESNIRIDEARTIISKEKLKGFKTEDADVLLSQSKQAFDSSDYMRARELANKSINFALDIDRDGVLNDEDFAPSIKNIYVYSGFIILLTGSILTFMNNIKKKERLKKEAISAVSAFSGNDINFGSGKLQSRAKISLNSGDYFKAKDFARRANEFYTKEKPLIDFLENLKAKRMFRDGISESLLNEIVDKIKKSSFGEAEKLLKDAENAINQENIILEKIEYIRIEIPGIYKSYIKETPHLIDRSMDDLKAGNFEVASSTACKAQEMLLKELISAKYLKEKNDFINIIESEFREGS